MKVTGDLSFVVGNTTWVLRGVTFVVPTSVPNARYWSHERPLTAQERAGNSLFVDRPWETGMAATAVLAVDASHA